MFPASQMTFFNCRIDESDHDHDSMLSTLCKYAENKNLKTNIISGVCCSHSLEKLYSEMKHSQTLRNWIHLQKCLYPNEKICNHF